jgi:hypothetical protein
VTLCVICTVHKETSSTSFLVEPQNQGRRVFQFVPQNRQLRFGDLGFKMTAMISCFVTQKILVCRLRHKTNRGRSA